MLKELSPIYPETPGEHTREVWVMFISLLFLSQATLFFNPDSFHFADRKNKVIF